MFEKVKKYFGLVEYYLIKLIGWFFLLIGLYNLIEYYSFFIDEEPKSYLQVGDNFKIMTQLFYFYSTFIFIPIIIGGFLLLKTNSLKSNKNE